MSGMHVPLTTAHYQKPVICRVPEGLPRATTRALGKEPLCRVHGAQHSANQSTRHNPYLPSAGAQQTKGTWQNMDMPSASERAHGKAGARARHARRPSRPFALPSASRLALGKMRFCRVSFPSTRQSPVLPKKNCGRQGNQARDLPHTENPPLPSRRSLFSVQLGLRFLKLYI